MKLASIISGTVMAFTCAVSLSNQANAANSPVIMFTCEDPYSSLHPIWQEIVYNERDVRTLYYECRMEGGISNIRYL
ncbi:hypothetical protein J8M21_14275 [Pseudoalteromonas luteoviolacea]|uniref:hypothetical protein n=1 Tax=Pseudoalteromonas luteoviolacea TaxID=43657 RepID=UPI001B39EF4A|nr:hypothetical protein [Pseudoalteromonas luteoviolacea]MBQ4878376.1 hypothetical protein [Pseudoalteromonas luteoviolacea]MBQ4907531.1 hypothetical protein [Pseudoalteromonas luteoviolacea]